MERDLEHLQDVISYRFDQVKLLVTALTHSSYANEQPCGENNERLEFLGDAVLELVTSEILYNKFPDAPEGALTRMRSRLVSEPALAEVARDLEMEQCILLGRGEDKQGGRDRNSLLSDALEAVFGAVFLDGGFAAAQHSIKAAFGDRIPNICDSGRIKDYKTRLQETTQRMFKERPVYTLLGSSGPEHNKVFEVEVLLPDETVITAEGQSMKKAEQQAAGKALEYLQDQCVQAESGED